MQGGEMGIRTLECMRYCTCQSGYVPLLTQRIGNHGELASGSPEFTWGRHVEENIPTRKVEDEVQYSQAIRVSSANFPYNHRHDCTDNSACTSNDHAKQGNFC
jgi:hypothetical protein